MPIKVTMLLQDATATQNPGPLGQKRIGGWSESWYVSGSNFQTAINDFISPTVAGGPVCQARAGLLTPGSSIVGLRVQGVGGVTGASQSLAVNFPGSYTSSSPASLLTTYPGLGLLCSVPATTGANIRRMVLRGLPQNVVKDGEYNPDQAFSQNLSTFFGTLNGLLFRGRDLTLNQTKIISVATDGTVTCEVAITVAPLQMVRILRTLNTAGTKIGGRFQVTSVGPGANVFKILGWTAGATAGGSVRADAIIYPAVNGSAIQISRVISRRVGRPFVQFRGRRSARNR